MVKGSNNWFHLMFSYQTCSNLNCAFKHFNSLHYGDPLATGYAAIWFFLTMGRERKSFVASLIPLRFGDSKKARVMKLV